MPSTPGTSFAFVAVMVSLVSPAVAIIMGTLFFLWESFLFYKAGSDL